MKNANFHYKISFQDHSGWPRRYLLQLDLIVDHQNWYGLNWHMWGYNWEVHFVLILSDLISRGMKFWKRLLLLFLRALSLCEGYQPFTSYLILSEFQNFMHSFYLDVTFEITTLKSGGSCSILQILITLFCLFHFIFE